jgi:hypothetical protein
MDAGKNSSLGRNAREGLRSAKLEEGISDQKTDKKAKSKKSQKWK